MKLKLNVTLTGHWIGWDGADPDDLLEKLWPSKNRKTITKADITGKFQDPFRVIITAELDDSWTGAKMADMSDKEFLDIIWPNRPRHDVEIKIEGVH